MCKNHDMKKIIPISLLMATLFALSCSTPSESHPPAVASESPAPPKANPTVLEGAWHGRDVTPGHEGPASMTVSGQSLEFHGGDANDWLKATFTLREDTLPKQWIGMVTDGPTPENIGKKIYAIYKIENGALTIAGHGPGDSDIPSAFDDPNSRQFVLKHDQ
jgi:uncharacterized protein (TIGR03067 family)